MLQAQQMSAWAGSTQNRDVRRQLSSIIRERIRERSSSLEGHIIIEDLQVDKLCLHRSAVDVVPYQSLAGPYGVHQACNENHMLNALSLCWIGVCKKLAKSSCAGLARNTVTDHTQSEVCVYFAFDRSMDCVDVV